MLNGQLLVNMLSSSLTMQWGLTIGVSSLSSVDSLVKKSDNEFMVCGSFNDTSSTDSDILGVALA